MSAVFQLQHVSYSYDAVMALNNVSMSINEGRRVALLGANGSGKSTLLRLLDGLYFADSGSISFFGEVLQERRFADDNFHFAFRRRVGMVFQDPDVQLFNPTVFDEVAFAPLQLGWSASEVRQRVRQVMEGMEIFHLKNRSPHRLSGGEKKRVALASVLVLDPDVLLLDEPTAALDPRSESQIIDLLVGWGDGKKTVVIATHDLGLAEDIADECFLLHAGNLVTHGVPHEILADSQTLLDANLIHAHRHRHNGLLHSHPHRHPHRHD
jgi:cobalt/nickel transport system ATP-binding protein